jgi:hypothetical protein
MQQKRNRLGQRISSNAMGQTDPQDQRPDEPGKGRRKLSVAELRSAAKASAEGVRLGKSPADIVAKLRQMGLTRKEAEGIEDHVRLVYQYSQMRIGTMLMVSGVLWLIAAFIVPVLRPGPSTVRYSWVIFTAGILQWLYGWQRRRRAVRIRQM